MSAPFRRVLANLSQGAQTVAPAPTAPHQQHPGGTNAASVPAVAPIAQAVAPVADEAAEALRRIGLDETEIATFPDAPSIFQRFDAMHETLERIAALLEASKPKEPIFEILSPDTSGGIQLHKHGRRYVGIRAGANHQLTADMTQGAMNMGIQTSFNWWLLPERATIRASTASDVVNYQFCYADEIGGSVIN